jgi:integrase
LAAKINRLEDHELWTSATDAKGNGLISVNGRTTTVRRAVWELKHGELPEGARVICLCSANPACVRLEHLAVAGSEEARPRRARKGAGSLRHLGAGRWELRVTVGRWDDGRVRTFYRSIRARNESDAQDQLRAFVEEMREAQLPANRELRDLTVDEAVEQFLTEYLGEEKGRTSKTVGDYRRLHYHWFSPTIGSHLLKRVDSARMDGLFGSMRRAGLSASRLNHARSLYVPFFRWAKRRGLITRNPLSDFEMPTSTYRSNERTPPEVEELILLLSTAVAEVPDVAPLLVLDAVTGMRRGELVAIRRSGVNWTKNRITVATAIDESKQVKVTKTRRSRTFHVDAETVAMLRRHCELADERAEAAGVEMAADPFLFSLKADCSTPMPPDFLTKRVGVLKGHLGIEDKRPEIRDLEDKALRLWREPAAARQPGKTGPAPSGGISFREIGLKLGRTERWASMAVKAAERREQAQSKGRRMDFDGSILALRKFTSSELLDAGFNLSIVAQRQGHGTQVLTRHYAKSRASADKRAAEHLGRVVHGAER